MANIFKEKEKQNNLIWKANQNILIIEFFLWVYGLSIPFWAIELWVDVKILPLDIPFTDVFAVFTPTMAALILVWKSKRYNGIKLLLRRIFDYDRIRNKMWLWFSILFPLVLFIINWIAYNLFDYDIPHVNNITLLSLMSLIIFFFIGAAAEEVGYTGYLTDLIQSRFNLTLSSLLIGLPWALWHVPSMIQQGRNLEFILWGIAGTVTFRALYIWYHLKTNKSLFSVLLLHTFYNIGRSVFPQSVTNASLVHYPEIHYSLIIILIIIIILTNSQ